MTCHDIQSLISARLDGELDPGRERTLQQHLDACPACRRLAGALAAADAALDALPEPEPAPGFAGRVMDRLGGQEIPRRFRPLPLALGVASFLGGVALAVLMNGEPRRDVQPDEIPAVPFADTFDLLPPGSPGAEALRLLRDLED
jgi:anti-sigma factor RsiW